MSTPFEAALKVQRRALDDVRVSISVQLNQLMQIQSSGAAIDAAMPRESAVAAADPLMSSYAYVTRMRARRVGIEQEEQVAAEGLDRLRSQAAEAYGSFRAIESADEAYRFEEARIAATAEQARADDVAGSAYVRARRLNSVRRGRS